LAVGYNQVSIDDCWANKTRDADGHMTPDADRFPAGMKALGDYMHAKDVRFGHYGDIGGSTCAKYPGIRDHKIDDANTFASWGVDYLKMDGCRENHSDNYVDYSAMGAALQAIGRNITYSCSWPAYTGLNESTKPFDEMIDAGCNLWRNQRDIQCAWGSLSRVIDHWGDYGEVLQPWAGPGHWHDMDMLLIGNDCVTIEEQKTQMAIWSISASPLIMGNDLRTVPQASKAILLNRQAVAVSQDPLGKMGIRHPSYTSRSPTQLWFRELANGDIAVALYNKGQGHELINATDITLDFAEVGFAGNEKVSVYDIWAQRMLGEFKGVYTAKNVSHHGSAFLRISCKRIVA
jgi:alpha-N-acetylgalactosaminidase